MNTQTTQGTTETTATNERKIDGIYRGPAPHWVGDGFRVMGFFSGGNGGRDLVKKLSPFLLLDYGAPHVFAPTTNTRRGVGPHPHRGFETVTVAFEGSVAHHDSTGAGGIIGPGSVQWMTAGSGILHREYHEAEFARRGGRMHMAQIWVNLPRAHKMTKPRYQELTASSIGVVTLPDDAGTVRVIAGEHAGVKGPAETFTPINLWEIALARNGKLDLRFAARENTAILVMKGEVQINGKARAAAEDLVLFENYGETIALEASSDAHLLLLNGEPIDEPVVQYGPFVMNTEREIQEAINDFRRGKFGQLAE